MRTTDDLQEKPKHEPLGDPIRKPEPAPALKQVPGAVRGVMVGPDGKLETRLPGTWA